MPESGARRLTLGGGETSGYTISGDELAALREKASQVAAQFPTISLIYLFGSRASGRADAQSDYDFAVVTDAGCGTLELQSWLAHELSILLSGAPVDVVMLDQAPLELAYNVIACGIVLYERSRALRIDFEVAALDRYFDQQVLLRQIDAVTRPRSREERHAARVRRYQQALGRTERTIGPVGRTSRTGAG